MATTTEEVYDGRGNLLSSRVVQVPVEETNRADYVSQADQAIDTLEAVYTNWATLTAVQKDAAMRLAIRIVTRLARLALGRLT